MTGRPGNSDARPYNENAALETVLGGFKGFEHIHSYRRRKQYGSAPLGMQAPGREIVVQRCHAASKSVRANELAGAGACAPSIAGAVGVVF
jgi:hypothetical protein